MTDYEKAEELALARGCVPENECWTECVDVALHEVESES